MKSKLMRSLIPRDCVIVVVVCLFVVYCCLFVVCLLLVEEKTRVRTNKQSQTKKQPNKQPTTTTTQQQTTTTSTTNKQQRNNKQTTYLQQQHRIPKICSLNLWYRILFQLIFEGPFREEAITLARGNTACSTSSLITRCFGSLECREGMYGREKGDR